MVLVGTAAYQTYAGIVGHFLPAASFATQDADISVVEFVPGENEGTRPVKLSITHIFCGSDLGSDGNVGEP